MEPAALPLQAWLTLLVGAGTLLGIAVGEIPRLRMNRATIAVVGAALVVVPGLRSLEAAYAAIDADTLVLLFAMMVLNANLRLAGFFDRSAFLLVRAARTPRLLLAATVALAGGLSALLLNDTIALGMTPLLLDVTRATGLAPLPFLLALATAANVGSTATIIGNPQNMIVGMAGGLSFLEFAAALTPVAVGGCVVVWAVIALAFRRELAPRELEWTHRDEGAVHEALLRKGLAATALLLVLLVAGLPVPLAALAAAATLLVTRRFAPERVFAEIDWSLLVMFSGLFVVTEAIEHAAATLGLRAALEPLVASSTASLTVVAALLSNVVSNVPAVLLLRAPVAALPDPQHGFLVLAMASTLAGNLTLLGSVANLIVAELARGRGVEVSFLSYLRVGVPITLLTLALGAAWLG